MSKRQHINSIRVGHKFDSAFRSLFVPHCLAHALHTPIYSKGKYLIKTLKNIYLLQDKNVNNNTK